MSDVYIKRATQARVDEVSNEASPDHRLLKPGEMVYVTDSNVKELLIGNNTKPNNSGVLVKDSKNVTTQINGKNISDIFESNGTTVKNATNVTSKINGIDIKGINGIFEEDGKTVKNATTASTVVILTSDDLASYGKTGDIFYEFRFNDFFIEDYTNYNLNFYVELFKTTAPTDRFTMKGTFSNLFYTNGDQTIQSTGIISIESVNDGLTIYTGVCDLMSHIGVGNEGGIFLTFNEVLPDLFGLTIGEDFTKFIIVKNKCIIE